MNYSFDHDHSYAGPNKLPIFDEQQMKQQMRAYLLEQKKDIEEKLAKLDE
jgi:hypothetical protein